MGQLKIVRERFVAVTSKAFRRLLSADLTSQLDVNGRVDAGSAGDCCY